MIVDPGHEFLVFNDCGLRLLNESAKLIYLFRCFFFPKCKIFLIFYVNAVIIYDYFMGTHAIVVNCELGFVLAFLLFCVQFCCI